MQLIQSNIKRLNEKTPIIQDVVNFKPLLWLNPHLTTIDSLRGLTLTKEDIFQANQLWERFAPYLQWQFPELAKSNGRIESPLKNLKKLAQAIEQTLQIKVNNLYLKCDHELSIAGSIKARGGFYEVLHHAEQLALEHGLFSQGENYKKFASDECRHFFSKYSIGVGSTGNLGLSIGIIASALGFHVDVYMSADSKKWTKELLRAKGVHVHAFVGDFGEAITKGRQRTNEKTNGYFIDDEKSEHLFLGYSTAAIHLKKQLAENNITVDEDHPLFLYLPCGVGGSPGGITFGVKHILGDHVHCFFAEPTHSPSSLIGLATGEKEQVAVQDVGIDNVTEADGLAVGRPSSFATDYNQHLVSGIFTVTDDELFKWLTILHDQEGIFVEPSATAGFSGPIHVLQSTYLEKHQIDPDKVTHVIWSTGGSLVPKAESKLFYEKGKTLLRENE